MNHDTTSAPETAPPPSPPPHNNDSLKRKRDDEPSLPQQRKRLTHAHGAKTESSHTCAAQHENGLETNESKVISNVDGGTSLQEHNLVTNPTAQQHQSNNTEEDPYAKLIRNLRNIFRLSHNIRYPSGEILSYVTPFRMAETLIKWMNALYFMNYQGRGGAAPAIYEMVDLTACIGGNVLEFGKAYAKVTCMELNHESYMCLRHNVHAYALANKVRATNENSMQWLFDARRPRFERDTGVFFDPPWGGREYNDRDTIPDLTMMDSEQKEYGVYDILRRCFDLRASIVCIKLPYNFECDQFRQRGLARTFEMRYNKCVYVVAFPQRWNTPRR